MKNIDKIYCFNNSTENSEFEKITTLTVGTEISTKGSIIYNEGSLLTNYIYREDGTYDLVYTIIDVFGNEESYKENDGVLPTLFLNPSLENYVSVIPYHPTKELEISIPIFNRENIEIPKGNRPFVGNFIGVSNKYSLFYDVDMWSDTKPDKLLAIEFKEKGIKKKYNVKVPLPRNNKIFINNDEIHLLSIDKNGWLHRQIDEKGNEIRKRNIKSTRSFFWQILSLSFEEDSYILSEKKGKIHIETITRECTCITQEVADIKDEFFNTWQPIKISEHTFVTRFNGEFGNGWLTTRKNELLELYYSKDVKGFKEIKTGRTLLLSEDNLVISSLNKTKENNYSVILYPMTDRETKNKIIILNKKLK